MIVLGSHSQIWVKPQSKSRQYTKEAIRTWESLGLVSKLNFSFLMGMMKEGVILESLDQL